MLNTPADNRRGDRRKSNRIKKRKVEITITYVMSDIHGNYNKYLEMLEKINFSEEDTLYILGDMIDRSGQSAELLIDVFNRDNVFPLMGNHEMMAIEVLELVLQEVITVNIKDLDFRSILLVQNWMSNGGSTTVESFKRLPVKDRDFLLEKMKTLPLYKDIRVGDNRFILVHAGLGNFEKVKPLSGYTKDELLCQMNNYERYFDDDEKTYIVSGHKSLNSYGEPEIMFKNNHIAIDCGSYFGGSQACLELETFQEYYIYEPDIF